jgi:hypothetical protein
MSLDIYKEFIIPEYQEIILTCVKNAAGIRTIS